MYARTVEAGPFGWDGVTPNQAKLTHSNTAYGAKGPVPAPALLVTRLGIAEAGSSGYE